MRVVWLGIGLVDLLVESRLFDCVDKLLNHSLQIRLRLVLLLQMDLVLELSLKVCKQVTLQLSLSQTDLLTLYCRLLLFYESAQTTDQLVALLDQGLLFYVPYRLCWGSFGIGSLNYWLDQTRWYHHIFGYLVFDFKFLLLSEVIHEDV